ncbi:uncharacterized protein LOC129728362 [Wyeomyia smithii]|uniref:uncharacterized protein LOC129728362 n=1 Tax=Wyeomyia smithii TaxID=174621 RepID=UPI002467BE3E|nr:uncharacterized protein LOC129728362 [Wyeomyia smithii]
MDNVMDHCIIEQMLKRPFAARTMEEKIKVIGHPVPRPPMEQLKSTYKLKGKIMSRNFNVSSYDQQWLCGSAKLNKLFCWPCLLFRSANEKNVWSKEGYSDLNHLSASIKTHSSSKDHINNSLALSMFGQMRIDEALDHSRQIARNKHNEEVTKNRKGMRTLIEITCFLGTHGLAFRGHYECSDSTNRGNYKDLCTLIAARDPAFQDFINNKVFSGTSGGIQNELIECIESYMLQTIKREVLDAECVSIMMDESTDSARLSQLSCTLRYLRPDGTPVERLVRLADVSSDKTAAALAGHVDEIVKACLASIEELKAEHHFYRTLNDAIDVSGETITDSNGINYRPIYDFIIDKIIDEMSKRFKELDEYKFIILLNHEKFAEFNVTFPTMNLKMLISYHSKFDEAKLYNELTVLYSREEFRGKNILYYISFILGQNLHQTFSETLRLARMILTLPNTTASVERTFSVLRRIKNYLRSKSGHNRLFGIMMMAVEKDLLHEMMLTPLFYDDIIDKFALEVNRRIPLLYE